MIYLGEIDIMDNLSTEVVTGKVRFNCVYLWEPRIINSNPEYSVCLLIPKSDERTLNDIRQAMKNAKEIGISILNYNMDLDLKMPLRDGDIERSDEVYEGCYFMYASSANKPLILDEFNNQINNKEDFYNGCYGYASINFYAFNTNGNKGIACGLNNLMKTDEGEVLGGKLSAELDFESVEAASIDTDMDGLL